MSDRRLVVNADDLGLAHGVDAGILRAHAEGIVTSTSLMVRGASAVEAAVLVRAHPRLDVGLHVDLAEWEHVAGRWRPRYEVVDTSDATAVRDELHRQVGRFAELLGRLPTHLDSHQHVHREEPVRSAMGALAKALRVPLRHHGRVAYCGAFYGQGHDGVPLAGAVTAEALTRIVTELPEGATELCCHPAAAVDPGWQYADERLAELAALCDPAVRAAVDAAGVRLCTFAEALTAL